MHYLVYCIERNIQSAIKANFKLGLRDVTVRLLGDVDTLAHRIKLTLLSTQTNRFLAKKSKTGNALLDQFIITLSTFGDVCSQKKRRSSISVTTISTPTTTGQIRTEIAADKTSDVGDMLAMSALI